MIAQGFCSHLLTIVAHCWLASCAQREISSNFSQKFLQSFNCLKLPEYLYTNVCLQRNGLQGFCDKTLCNLIAIFASDSDPQSFVEASFCLNVEQIIGLYDSEITILNKNCHTKHCPSFFNQFSPPSKSINPPLSTAVCSQRMCTSI